MARASTIHRMPDPVPAALPVTVCVVDDDEETRQALKFLLEAKRIPVAIFESAIDFLKNWRPERTGCLVIDNRMPGMTGRELQIELIERGHSVPIIMMTGYGDVPLAVETMGRGALHFFEKPVPYEKLIEMIEIGLEKSEESRVDVAEFKEFERRYNTLSPQERKVAELVALGLRSQDIAGILDIVAGTVDLHRGRVYDKMKVRNVAELVRMLVSKRAPNDPPKDP